MNTILELSNSTYTGYQIILSRISYISRIIYNNKLKEYYFELGYESREFSKFILSFSSEKEAEKKRSGIISTLNEYYST